MQQTVPIRATLAVTTFLLWLAGSEGARVTAADAPPVSCLSTQVWFSSGAPAWWVNPVPFESDKDSVSLPASALRGPRFGLVDDGSPIIIPIQIARIANDDGSRQTHITPAQAQSWLTYANSVFSVANITFTFDPLSGFNTIRSTLVNGMTGTGDANWDAERKESNRIAANCPGRMTLIARWGPNSGPTGGGFAWFDYNYVTIPGFNDTGLCSHQNINLCAHEIGHHLGLPHTFWAQFPSVVEAAPDFASRGNDPNAYDGDGIPDTPPHPDIINQACSTPDTFVLNGITITNARVNIMSYFNDAQTISPQQVQRVRWLALNYKRNAMQGPSNKGLLSPFEAESLTIVSSPNVSAGAQGMAGFGPDGWSNNQQLFMGFNTASANITLRVNVPTAGQYRVEFYATQAPDYGIVQCAMDGVNIGATVDGYAPVVVPTGVIILGTTNLAAGNHNFRMTRAGKNALSTGFLFGADAIRLVSVTNIVAPAIAIDPLSQIVDAGAIVTLHTIATGQPLKYQWLFNNVPIVGATNADYPINPALTTHTGNYSVIVSNSLASVTSSNALLTVNAAPISAQWVSAGTNRLWSNTNNWSPARVPESHTDVSFDNTAGFTNAAGLVNSVVDSSLTVQKLTFDARAPNHHTLRLNPGVTLTANHPGVADTPLGVAAQSGTTEQEYLTIQGTNASLVTGDTNAPVGQPSLTSSDPGTACEIWLRSSVGGSQQATLDMSGLENFSFGGGYVRVGGGSSGSISEAVARGKVLLAKTNFILAVNAYNPTLNLGGVSAGFRSAPSVASTDRGEIALGVMNRIYADYIKIGGNRNCTGMMAFQASALAAIPQLILRNTNGTSRISNVEIGDTSRQTTSANETSYGTVELSGGTVNALINNLYVGRSIATAGSVQGNGNGLLAWTGGTIDATTLGIGVQGGNNNSLATGVVNVGSNALLIATTINLGGDGGNNATGTGNGTLNLNGGTVNAVNLFENNVSGGNGASTILVTNGGRLNVASSIIVDTVAIGGGGSITNGGSLIVQNLRGTGTIRGSVSIAGSGTLRPGSSLGTLAISNSLTLAGSSTSTFEVNLDTLVGDTVVGMNNLVYGGTLIVTNIGGTTARTNGAELKLFSAATYQNVFTGFSLPPPGPGLKWDTTTLTNGVIRLVNIIDTTPVPLAFQFSGNALDLSWPADHIGWRLECQTNAVGAGLSPIWFTLPGSTLTNHFLLPLDAASGSVFYRLAYP